MNLDGLGLTQVEAEKRLVKYGENILPEKKHPGGIYIFLTQIKNPLVYLLLFSGLLTFLIGHYSDTLIILFAVFINTTLGYLQENKASKALSALKKLIKPSAEVIRDGNLKTIDVSMIVIGDFVYLTQGDKVPADGNLVSGNKLFIEEAILTGESAAIEKNTDDEVFMGTLVVAGTGYFEVKKTGGKTQMGKIAENISDTNHQTPLKRQLTYFSKQLVYIVVGLAAVTLTIGLVKNNNYVEMLSTSIALVVSAIPEGLLVVLTVILAIGMQRILKRNGLVRNLASAETLGGVTTICVDKTGTLTKGDLEVVGVSGDEKSIAEQFLYANDLDDPIVITAFNWAKKTLGLNKTRLNRMQSKNKIIDRKPFSAQNRYFASLNKIGGENYLFVNGAPERVLGWCKLDKSEKEKIISIIEAQSQAGNRIVGLAKKKVATSKNKIIESDINKDLTWVGLVYFSDPIREGVKESLQKAVSAGVRIIVITGDFGSTAIAVMHKLGLKVSQDEVVLGESWEGYTESEKKKVLEKVKLFARTSPDQKLSVVRLLKEMGEVVAMMGDGVNDAPALNYADIGIVVGSASDVSKETADLILLDSKFETIVAAIEEGRGIFDNIRKIILYLMSTAFNEIVAVMGALILGFPIPVTAAQILWINIVTDGFPDLALTVDPKRKNIMNVNPRKSGEKLVSGWMKILIAIISSVSGILALTLFVFVLKQTQDVVLARSVGFLTLGLNSLFYVFSVRMLDRPIWEQNFTSNHWLLVALIAGGFFQILPFTFDITRNFFTVKAVPFQYLWMIIASGVTMIILTEIIKYFVRSRYKVPDRVKEVLI